MEILKDYKARVYSFMKKEISEEDEFRTNGGLSAKISKDGSFCTFVGDTMVFLLDDDIKIVLHEWQNKLYDMCQEMLADRIDPETFHITLHDLCNGQPSGELCHQFQQNLTSVRHIMRKFQCEYDQLIRVRSVAVFNMTNTSIVLGLEPADERSCQYLMEMYENLQRVKKLDYLLTLHITLAYFKPGIYGRNTVFKLRNVLKEINDKNMPVINLNIHQLLYQRFDDMNHYYSVKE